MSQSSVLHLADLIQESVQIIDKLCKDNNFNIPDLSSPGFSTQSEAFRSNPAVADAAKITAAACMQLATSLLPPTDFLFSLAVGDSHSAAVRVCLEANVTEILREAGPEGLHVDVIAAKCGLDAPKLSRIIRYLTTHHVYREVKPDVFTNNRISGTLDTRKSLKDITANPEGKYDSAGFPALLSHHLDIDHKCSVVAWDTLKEGTTECSQELTRTIFSRGLNVNMTYWDFFKHPDNHFRHRRFGFVMQGMEAIQPSDMIFRAFNWNILGKDAIVVDVGGGIGIATMPLARRYTEINIVIQDLPNVVEEGKRFWKEKYPKALQSGRVKLETHDFFEPQPIKGVSAFIVKQVLHNWPSTYIKKLLSRLREAASKDAVLIIIDNVLPYACRVAENERTDAKEEPEPLLPNYGAVCNSAYTLDMMMMFYFNSQEPTIKQLTDLLTSTGWKIVKFRSIDPRSHFLKSVEAIPA
ncbi:O-methyltransferase [Crucibulum laeve]|uniref:O-methyltransferase n=1 Tax=Crucibulum laeve TaxID=68775 RepID=A0A5C3LYJ5_9AGAR|nr:O-methyltransferase [Crucibulum laeve]